MDAIPEEPRPMAAEPPTRWQRFRMLVKVVELRLRFIVLMAGTGLVFGYWDTLWNYYEKWTRPPGEHVAATSDEEFFCPMHPQVIQGQPGSCPICGMPLSKRKKGETAPLPPGVLARVTLSPMRLEQAGVRTSEVAYSPLVETITTAGFVEHDETRLKRIVSKLKGMSRIESLRVNFVGMPVAEGDVLAEVYNPELRQALQELLVAGRAAAQARRASSSKPGASLLGDPNEAVQTAADKLRLWGITRAQVDQILAAGRAPDTLTISSPMGGHVVEKKVVQGQYVAEGETLFEIADLTHVWVKARVFEDQIGLLQVGQTVEATVPAFPGVVFSGAVAFIDPMLDPSTRTLGIRFDLNNADHRLRLGMYATVTLKTPAADLPAFRTRLAKGGAAKQEKCPVTSLRLGAMGKPFPVQVGNKTILTCCPDCEPKVRARPARYLARVEPAPRDAVLSVPESAVVDTGTRKIVYVESEPGVFEGREVVLGPIAEGRYPVLDGLEAGDRVAEAGAFLIDAENRLNPEKRDEEPQRHKETQRTHKGVH